MSDSLQPTSVVDSDHPAVVAFAHARTADARDDRDRAIALYYAVRDEIRYDPYGLDPTPEGMRASRTLEQKRGWCVPKAALLSACCRVVGVPAKVGFADVRNHLSTARLRERMGSDIFYWHGYSAILLDDVWVKATPAFNVELCEKFRIRPLEFDGRTDSIYHPFDMDGRKHMQYLAFRGEFDDVPLREMFETFVEKYRSATYDPTARGDSFDADVDAETSSR